MPLFDCCGGCISLKAATLIIAVLDLLANIFLVVQFGGSVAVMVQGRINHPEESDSGAFLDALASLVLKLSVSQSVGDSPFSSNTSNSSNSM